MILLSAIDPLAPVTAVLELQTHELVPRYFDAIASFHLATTHTAFVTIPYCCPFRVVAGVVVNVRLRPVADRLALRVGALEFQSHELALRYFDAIV